MFKLEIKIQAVEAVLRDIGQATAHTMPLMREIAGIMHGEVEENFIQQGRPRWLGLKPETIENRVKRQLKKRRGILKSGAWSIIQGREAAAGIKILQDTGGLVNSIHEAWDETTSAVGTNKVYAAIQNNGGQTRPHVILPKNKQALAFGGRVVKKVNHPGSKIPARPFMTLGDDGGRKIEDAALDYLRRVAGD